MGNTKFLHPQYKLMLKEYYMHWIVIREVLWKYFFVWLVDLFFFAVQLVSFGGKGNFW